MPTFLASCVLVAEAVDDEEDSTARLPKLEELIQDCGVLVTMERVR
ncbi:MAG: hypothetical protein ACRD1T_14850 [Acidimicrobiia bacterium]